MAQRYIKVGDRVRMTSWVYAVSTACVQNAADTIKAGRTGTVTRLCGINCVVVHFGGSWYAPVHPEGIQPIDG